ncbi:hypothetical protein [Methylobacterium sp. Leaf118]|uniref:hypothetical protein n=1 Tax=Methylobacterium sp. Leaf118 TaxID=2876562 RepID=UPI001E2E8E4C|nr:hypothetical protein [Methylobacterium sp. Leaf118]
MPAGACPPIHHVLGTFESIGDNCEFGLVQRYGGVDQLGLLKFSASRIENLIHALDTDFELYGRGDDLHLTEHSSGYLFCVSRRYGFDYNTGHRTGSVDPDSLLKKEVRKVGYLKRRFLEDLRSGEKVLVRKDGANATDAGIAALMRALRRHGPATLLWVRAAGASGPVPPLRWREDGLIEGWVGDFAPYDAVVAIDLPPWFALCRQAWALVRGLPALPALPPANLLPRFGYLARRHRPDPDADQTVFGPLVDLAPLDRRAVHAFSCWVRIPGGFRGEGLAAAIGDRRIRWREADLGQRGTWQRVFVTATLPEGHGRLRVGLVARGPASGVFHTAGWRLEEAPEPSAAPHPPLPARILARF